MGRKRRPQSKHLAKKLKAIRLALGLTQPEMAERLSGIPSAPDGAMISRYERGEREPSLFAIVAYAKIAKVSTDVLIDDSWSLSDLKKLMPKH